MVQVKGTSGKIVNIEVLGINAVMLRLLAAKQHVKQGADLGVIRAGGFIEEEVKESIMGNRAEPKSVETGQFGNSIEFNKIAHAEGIIKPRRENYPGKTTTTEDVALAMEYSPKISGGPRRHFGNTKMRNKTKVKDIIEKEIKKII